MPKRPDLKSFTGESYGYDHIETLYIDFLPSTCLYRSTRSVLVSGDFKRLKKYIIAKAGGKCECCRKDGAKPNPKEDEKPEDILEIHERWHYDYQTETQILRKIIAICKKCQSSTRYGQAYVIGLQQQAKDHIMEVRKWSSYEFQVHRQEAYKEMKKRNSPHIKWTLNVKLLANNGLKLRNKFIQKMEEWNKMQSKGSNHVNHEVDDFKEESSSEDEMEEKEEKSKEDDTKKTISKGEKVTEASEFSKGKFKKPVTNIGQNENEKICN